MSGHDTIPGREYRRQRLRPERDFLLRTAVGTMRHGDSPPGCSDARHTSVTPARLMPSWINANQTLQRRFVSGQAAPALGFCEKQSTKCEVTGGLADAAPAATATTATTATADEKPDRAGNRLVHPAAGISQFQARTHQRRTALAHQTAGGRVARSAQTHPQNIPSPTPFLKGYPL